MSGRRGTRTPPPSKSFWQRYQWFIIAGVAMFFVITVVAPALGGQAGDTNQQQTNTPATTTASVQGEFNFPSRSRDHVPFGTRVSGYGDPPTSGAHWSEPGVAPIAWGIYTQPVADEALVHNLEHGGIVIYYRASAPDTVRAQLTEFVQNQSDYPTGFILAPRANLPADITLTAWEYYLPVFQFNEPQMRAFISAHYDQGPEGLMGGPR